MKCLYCEENETKGVLLCYGCQVDLFPLVAAWAYCGVCGQELPDNSTLCPHCAQGETLPVPVAAPAAAAAAAALTAVKPRPVLPSLVPEPPATPAEIKAARRFQWIIRGAFALFWLLVALLILWWLRNWVNEPVDGFLP